MRTTLFLAAILAFQTAMTAADTTTKQPDQTIVLEGLPRAIPIPDILAPGAVTRPPAGLASTQVTSLITQLVAAAGGAALDDHTYYMLHLVCYKDGTPDTREDAWYVYYRSWVNPSAREKMNDPDVMDHFKEARLFGAKKLSFLYLHYGIPAGPVTLEAAQAALAARWQAMLPAEHESATNLALVSKIRAMLKNQDPDHVSFTAMLDESHYADARKELSDQIDSYVNRTSIDAFAEFRLNGGRIVGPRQKDLKPLSLQPDGNSSYVESDFLPITYQIDVTKKQSILEQDLGAVLGQFGLQATTEIIAIALPRAALLNTRLDMEINYPTSDIVVTGVRGTVDDVSNAAKLIATKKYDNERLYPVDFGFALPLKSVNELTFSTTAGVQPKAEEKNRFFGTVDFFPFGPVDTKASKIFRLAPELIYGMALNDTPWNHHLIALGFGLKWAQPFVGVTATRNAISSATNMVAGYKWNWQISYGVQIPASGISALIKGATK